MNRPAATPPLRRRVSALAALGASLFGAILPVLAPPARAAGDDPARRQAIASSIDRAVAWLRTVHVEPYAGDPLSFRLFAVEVEIWHRLWLLEPNVVQRAAYDQEVRERLQPAIDKEALADLLSRQGETNVYTEVLVLINRSRRHLLNAKPMADALRLYLPDMEEEIARAPASLKAVYAAYLPAAQIDLGLDLKGLRLQGMLAKRPRESDLTLADVYYLTHEIYAHTDYAAVALRCSDEEAAYLRRVLPFYTLFYANLNNIDILAELVTCLHAADLKDTFAYQEGIRVLVERQNPDGSFGSIDPRGRAAPPSPREYLHPTMNALWALMLEQRR